MKQYFTRQNVITVLTLIFSGISILGYDHYNIRKQIFIDLESRIDILSEKENLYLDGLEILIFCSDSIMNIRTRSTDYFLFLENANKRQKFNFLKKAIELRRSVLSDKAKISKFENIKKSIEVSDLYYAQKDYLNCENKIVDYLYEYSNLDYTNISIKKQIYINIESQIVELEFQSRKLFSKSFFWSKRLLKQNPKSIKDKLFQDNIEKQKKISFNYLIGCVLLSFLWIIISYFAIKFETFKD